MLPSANHPTTSHSPIPFSGGYGYNLATLDAHRYADRWWQEESFKDLKSSGWQWQGSAITCPQRMECLLLVMAIAYGWMLSLGTTLHDLPREQQALFVSRDELRRFSLFRLGLHWFRHLLFHAPQRLRVALAFALPAFRGFT